MQAHAGVGIQASRLSLYQFYRVSYMYFVLYTGIRLGQLSCSGSSVGRAPAENAVSRGFESHPGRLRFLSMKITWVYTIYVHVLHVLL